MDAACKYQEELTSTMLPFVMRELVELVMKKKALPLGDALYYIYSSRFYKSLSDENTKLWYFSTLSLYDILEKEKAEEKQKQSDNTKVLLFKMFCIENYREAKKKHYCCFPIIRFLIFWMKLLKCFIPRILNIYWIL